MVAAESCGAASTPDSQIHLAAATLASASPWAEGPEGLRVQERRPTVKHSRAHTHARAHPTQTAHVTTDQPFVDVTNRVSLKGGGGGRSPDDIMNSSCRRVHVLTASPEGLHASTATLLRNQSAQQECGRSRCMLGHAGVPACMGHQRAGTSVLHTAAARKQERSLLVVARVTSSSP